MDYNQEEEYYKCTLCDKSCPVIIRDVSRTEKTLKNYTTTTYTTF